MEEGVFVEGGAGVGGEAEEPGMGPAAAAEEGGPAEEVDAPPEGAFYGEEPQDEGFGYEPTGGQGVLDLLGAGLGGAPRECADADLQGACKLC